jgi:hypothetical protein
VGVAEAVPFIQLAVVAAIERDKEGIEDSVI